MLLLIALFKKKNEKLKKKKMNREKQPCDLMLKIVDDFNLFFSVLADQFEQKPKKQHFKLCFNL